MIPLFHRDTIAHDISCENDHPISPAIRVCATHHLYQGFYVSHDENRDAKQKLQKRIESDSDAILVAEKDGNIVGTVSLIEDGRVAWLFRFCVIENNDEIAQALCTKAKEVLKKKGHHQVLVYTPLNQNKLYERYEKLGFTKGGDYTCFWKDI